MKYKNRTLRVGLLLAFLFLFALGQSASAATVTAIASGNWSAGGTWSSGAAPLLGDDVVIPTGMTVTITGNVGAAAAPRTITIEGTGSLATDGLGAWTLYVAQNTTGGIYVNSTSAAAFDANGAADLVITIGTTTYQGDFHNLNTGTVDLTGATLTLSGTLTNSGTMTTTATTDLTLNGSTAVVVPAAITSLLNLTVNKVGSSVTLSADLTIDAAGGLTISSGTFVVGDNDLTVTGTTSVSAGATLNANSTETQSRTFTDAITFNGTINSSGGSITNTFTAALTIAANAVLNIEHSLLTTFTSTVASGGATAYLYANGANVTFTGIVTFTNLTMYSNSNTSFIFGDDQSGAGDEIPALSCKNLTFSNNATLAGNLTVYGDFDNTAAMTTTVGTYTFTVYGDFNNPSTGIFDATGSTLNFYGTITHWGDDETEFATDNTTTFNILGSGSIVAFPAGAGAGDFGYFTMNRNSRTFDLSSFAQDISFTSLTVTSGTVTLDDGVAVDIDNATNIEANGTLITNGATTVTFNGSVLGTGIIDANHADDELIITSGSFIFTGNMITANTTILTFSTAATTATLPSSIENLEELRLLGALAHKVTLSSNVALLDQIAVANFADAAGTLYVNGYTLTLTGGIAATGATTVDLTNGSTLISVAAANFTAMTLVEDNTTNVEFQNTVTAFPATFTECDNITLTTAGVLTMTAGLTLYGNLDVGSGCTIDKATFDLTVYGDVTNIGTMTLSGNGGTIYLYGAMQGTGTYTTDETTILIARGTSSALQLPVQWGATAIGKIVVERANGVVLNRSFTLGDAAGTDSALVCRFGNIDLNGYTITLSHAGDLIYEYPGYKIINTGATISGTPLGCIQTAAAVSGAQAIASNIGILAMTVGGNVQVRRFPVTIPIPDVGLAVSRVYQILTTAPTVLTLEFDNTETNSAIADLELYTNSAFPFTTAVKQTTTDGSNRTVTENSPITGKSKVAYSSFNSATAVGDFYALAGLPGDGGVLRTFAAATGNWGDAANWSPVGVPSKYDQVVIGPATVYLNGNGNIYECKSLLMNHASSYILPTDNTINGDNVSLRVMGNINLSAAGAEILGVNGYGRLSLIIGDGESVGVSSTITAPVSYVPTSGIWMHNLTINMANVSFANANEVRISGNVSLLSNTYLDADNNTLVFWGGYGNNTITIPISAAATFQDMKFDNNANVTTTSSFEVTREILVYEGSSFAANNGTVTFTASGIDAWTVEDGGTLKLYNVDFNDNNNTNITPNGDIYIQGDLYKSGQSNFAPTNGTVIFSNITQREIVNASTNGAAELIFYNLQIAEGSSIVTSTSWQVSSEIDIKNNASLIADQGTISMVGATPATKWIKNVSTHTLEFFDLDLTAGTTYTTDSWTIHGDLTSTAGSLVANNGTITFDNYAERSIDDNDGGTFQFFKILITDASKVTTPATATEGSFTIANNATYPSGAGIEVQGTGEFYVGAAATVTTFNAGAGVVEGYPKTITKSAGGTLEFGMITIVATPANEVTTATDFEITGAGAAAFNNTGAGGYFEATDGTVTFSGAAPVAISVSPAVTIFNNLTVDGGSVASALTFTDAQDFRIRGDLTVNGISTLAPVGTNTRIIFDGTGQQIIGGTSTTVNAISFADLTINKADDSDVLMEIDMVAGSNAAHEINLQSGYLNLGSQTLTVGAGIISRNTGAFNGGTGTYIINTNHVTPKLEDAYFTVSGTPTLYNLTVSAAHTTTNDLTVNGNLYLNGFDLTIASALSAAAPKLLTVNGNLSRNGGEIAGSATLSRLVLAGTGTVTNGLSNAFFNGGTATTVQLEVARQETLGGNLNIANTSFLRVNTGINDFDLGIYKLTFNATSFITMISGGIKAGTSSTVDLTTSFSNTVPIPASMFRNNECYNLTIGQDITIQGDLAINGTWTGAYDVTTGDNILTIGPSAVIPALGSGAYIKGNLRRTVVFNPATIFYVGDATNYYPVTLKFGNSTSSQAVVVKPNTLDPTEGRGGDPKYSVNAYWDITTEGTAPVDSIKAVFQWPSGLDGGTTPSTNASFPAKWTGSYWYDYRSKLSSFTVPSPRVLTMASYPIANSAALNGVWAIFNATDTSTAAKDRAIATSRNRLVITKIEPLPVKLGLPFKVTVQLQNQYGQPITTTTPFELQIQKDQGAATLTGTTVTGIIPTGESEVTVSGMTLTTTEGANHVLKADTTGGSLNWQIAISEPFAVVPATPTTQATAITFTYVKPTSMTISWTTGNGANELVVMKADTLLKEDEFPVNATHYDANTIYGAGATFGNAVVVYNGSGTTVNITGLAPNTTYYVYVFTYDGSNGYESYRTTAASGNPNAKATTGSYDDDVAYGINNTRELSKAIGTNSPVRGTVKSDTDEDWFNFTMTSASPNLRIKIYNLPENYNIELYDQTGKRVRRSYLQNDYVDSFIMNELSAGTYTVRVYGYNGVYDTANPYTLQVTTNSSEIFSVTP